MKFDAATLFLRKWVPRGRSLKDCLFRGWLNRLKQVINPTLFQDYCASRLVELLTKAGLSVKCQGVSHHLKKIYAERNTGVNFQELLSDSPYKEKYRKDMIAWGESVRREDPAFFCRLVEAEASQCDVFIIPDCRRPSDFQHFEDPKFKKIRVKVWASEEVRAGRGWKFVKEVDDAESECALDDWESYDLVVENSGDGTERSLQEIVDRVSSSL